VADVTEKQMEPALDAVAAATALPIIEADCTVKSWLETAGRHADSIPELIAELGKAPDGERSDDTQAGPATTGNVARLTEE